MANRCKPGDLAVVVQAQHKENLGRIVKVLKLHDRTGPLVYATDIVVWSAECPDPMKWTLNNRVYMFKEGPIPDSSLQPIRKAPARKAKRTVKVLEVA